MKLWKIAAAAAAMVLGASPAAARFFTAAGSVLDQPVVTLAGNSGTVSFANARAEGVYLGLGTFRPVPISALINFSVAFDLAQSPLIFSDMPNVFVTTGISAVTTDFDALFYRARVTAVGDLLTGRIHFGGNTPDGSGGLEISFTGSQASGFTSTFVLQVPELETWALMLVGFSALGATVRRQRVRFAAA